MKSKRFVRIVVFISLLLLIGCGGAEAVEVDIADVEKSEADSAAGIETSGMDFETDSEAFGSSASDPAMITEGLKAEELLDAFLANEIPAIFDDGVVIMLSDLPVGKRVDLDNDGEKELILNGPYGGYYLDARGGKVYVLAQGEGTSGELFFTYYDNAVWVVHCDVTHAGRQMYWLTQYDGEGNIVDEFQFSAEYWDSPPGSKYDENSDFTFRDKKISMEEYEALGKEIFGW